MSWKLDLEEKRIMESSGRGHLGFQVLHSCVDQSLLGTSEHIFLASRFDSGGWRRTLKVCIIKDFPDSVEKANGPHSDSRDYSITSREEKAQEKQTNKNLHICRVEKEGCLAKYTGPG